jgi:acid phosphatase type 7
MSTGKRTDRHRTGPSSIRRHRIWLTAVAGALLVAMAAVAASGAATARSSAGATVVVPRVNGGALAAYGTLHARGLLVSIPQSVTFDSLASLHVKRVVPSPGIRTLRGSAVTLYVRSSTTRSPARARRLPSYSVPRFTGGTVSSAYSWAKQRGLAFRAHLAPLQAGGASTLLANYRVSRQQPAGGRLALGHTRRVGPGKRTSFRLTPLSVWGTPPTRPPAVASRGPTISGTAQVGQSLTGQAGQWNGTQPLRYSYQWLRCDGAGAGCVPISGSTSGSYVVVADDIDHTLRLLVTVINTGGRGSARSIQTAIVIGAPVNTAPPTITGSTQDGQTLTANGGSWSGTTPLSYAYQWLRCDQTGAGCNPVAGMTAQTYVLTPADVGAAVRVIVTVSNSVGSSSTSSSATSAVAATPPANTAVPTISGIAQVGHSLTAGQGGWNGTPRLAFAYQWRRCGSSGSGCVAIGGATSPNHLVVDADTGHALRVMVTATNVAGSATASSDPAVVTPSGADPVIAAAGDIACDPLDPNFNNGFGVTGFCQALATSDLLLSNSLSAVLPLGDDQYDCGSLSAFQSSYDLSWGRLKGITHPVPGNHEYLSSNTFGGSGCSRSASGYFSYFGSSAGTAGQGYYSYDVGTWHIIALNSNDACLVVSCASGSAQEQWLQNDLAADHAACTLAYWHHPLFSTEPVNTSAVLPFWQDLYAAGADVVLNGHAHNYERFAQQNPLGAADSNGIREFIVGTGGDDLVGLNGPFAANSQVHNGSTFGILKLTLHADSYDWQFIPKSGSSFTDSGSTACHH